MKHPYQIKIFFIFDDLGVIIILRMEIGSIWNAEKAQKRRYCTN